ncbi:MAG: hypothetical protein IJC04_03235 [Oscillospiraceae bacterium]|nr:hypothetical protein [Oscillospiraceae bacterium]
MKYFCKDNERIGTCYHEFQKGKFNGTDFWKANSLCIHDDIHCKIKLGELIQSVVPEYSPTGETTVTREQWEVICCKANEAGGELAEAVAEADIWVRNVFDKYDVFTMIGI